MALGQASARFMDGQSADDHPAQASMQGAEVVVSTRDGTRVLARWPIAEVRVDAMHEGGVVHVECTAAPDALLSLEDPLFVKTLRLAGARVQELPRGRRGLAIGLSCFAAFATLMAALYAGAPWLSARAAHRVPVSVEREIASRMTSFFARRTCSTPKADDALQRMLKRLDPDGRVRADVRVVNLAMPNAFALPGGIVLLTRGLLEEADGADEVAGVLAHELAHVQHRHAMAHMIRNALLGVLWAATLGDYSGIMIVDPKTAYDTATLKYSREAEAEADATALRMLTDRGISAQGIANFLARHRGHDLEGMTWLSSHPASSDRVATLVAQALPQKAAPVLDAEAFYHLRNACESVPTAGSVRDLFF